MPQDPCFATCHCICDKWVLSQKIQTAGRCLQYGFVPDSCFAVLNEEESSSFNEVNVNVLLPSVSLFDICRVQTKWKLE